MLDQKISTTQHICHSNICTSHYLSPFELFEIIFVNTYKLNVQCEILVWIFF